MNLRDVSTDERRPSLHPRAARRQAVEILSKAKLVGEVGPPTSPTGVIIRQEEIAQMEVADFGLDELAHSGAQILTLVSTEQIAVKLIVLLPEQTLPEHTHPSVGDYAGKEETLRCVWGIAYLYGPGEPTPAPQGHPPAHRRATYRMWHEHVLQPGEQVTLQPGTPHWFQAGPDGAVLWSFSTMATDTQDIFTDSEIQR